MLTLGQVQCRQPLSQEFELLTEWRAAYIVEAQGQLENPSL